MGTFLLLVGIVHFLLFDNSNSVESYVEEQGNNMEVNELSYGQTRHVVQLLSRLGENKILANMIINSTQIEVKEKLREMGGFTTLDAWRISKIYVFGPNF